MSIISTAHTTFNYDSKKSVALEGQRLAKVLFKTTANVTAPMASQAVSVPFLKDEVVAENLLALTPHILCMLEDAQNEIIRAKLLETGGSCTVHDSEITAQCCIAYLNEAAKGNRLSKESIAAWFTQNVADVLSIAIADKLGMSDIPSDAEVKKLNKIVSDYSEKFQALAGSKTVYSPEIAQKLVRALEVSGCEDRLAQQFTVKLKGMKEQIAADLLAL